MDKRKVEVYYGKGKGKTTAAVGQCIRAASQGKSVIMIQFLKGKDIDDFSFLLKLEPSIKLFCFEKAHECYRDLNEEEKKEERKNILNGFNFARKVIETGECDVLVLDEILGLIDLDIITVEDIITLINLKDDYYKLLLTGQNLPEELVPHIDRISEIVSKKD